MHCSTTLNKLHTTIQNSTLVECKYSTWRHNYGTTRKVSRTSCCKCGNWRRKFEVWSAINLVSQRTWSTWRTLVCSIYWPIRPQWSGSWQVPFQQYSCSVLKKWRKYGRSRRVDGGRKLFLFIIWQECVGESYLLFIPKTFLEPGNLWNEVPPTYFAQILLKVFAIFGTDQHRFAQICTGLTLGWPEMIKWFIFV